VKKKIELAIQNDKIYMISQLIAMVSLLGVLKLGLLPLLLSGLILYHIVNATTPLYTRIGIMPHVGKIISLVTVAVIVMSSISLGILALTSFFNSGSGGLIELLQKMADTIDAARSHLPAGVQEYLPANVKDLQVEASAFLREHASQLTHISKKIGVGVIYILTGMIIGGMVAFHRTKNKEEAKPLSHLLGERVRMFSGSFHRIVFSQIKISAINTLLTGIFLAVILPLFGIVLPLTKTMILVTFIVGLLPVLGNLISNTVIVLIALGTSASVAVAALSFLVIIHKLEYFLNAHIIGTHINAKAWEILLAMIIMEAIFGIAGVIAAPIYYCYLKEELSARGLI
jgi:predicted PurR-regulated permease PerM